MCIFVDNFNLLLSSVVSSVINPGKVEECQDILRLAESFHVHKLPIRIGLVFITTNDTDSHGLTDPSIAAYNAFRFIQQRKSPQNALSFLTDVYAKVKEDGLTSELIISFFKEKFPQEIEEAVFGAESVYADGRSDGRRFVERLNIASTPLALLNGVPLDSSKLNLDEFENEVLQSLVAVYSGGQAVAD